MKSKHEPENDDRFDSAEQANKSFAIFIGDDGTTYGLKSPLTRDLQLQHRERVSHIEPANRMLRWFFRWIRSRVKDDSITAGFTRKWPCQWQVHIIDGPTFGPFNCRQKAIESEIAFVTKQHEQKKYEPRN